jgi:hypothetical protein
MGLLGVFLFISALIIMINDWDRAVHPNQRPPRKFGKGLFQDCDGGNWQVWNTTIL